MLNKLEAKRDYSTQTFVVKKNKQEKIKCLTNNMIGQLETKSQTVLKAKGNY